jgi:hypothetical protein
LIATRVGEGRGAAEVPARQEEETPRQILPLLVREQQLLVLLLTQFQVTLTFLLGLQVPLHIPLQVSDNIYFFVRSFWNLQEVLRMEKNGILLFSRAQLTIYKQNTIFIFIIFFKITQRIFLDKIKLKYVKHLWKFQAYQTAAKNRQSQRVQKYPFVTNGSSSIQLSIFI